MPLLIMATISMAAWWHPTSTAAAYYSAKGKTKDLHIFPAYNAAPANVPWLSCDDILTFYVNVYKCLRW